MVEALVGSRKLFIDALRAIDERLRRIQLEEEELLFAELILVQDRIVPLILKLHS